MHRRTFMRRTLAAAAGTLAVSLPRLSVAGSPRRSSATGFSLHLVTDRPDRSVALAGRMLEDLGLASPSGRAVSVSMDLLAGEHVGDLVLMRGAEVLDYRRRDGRLADALRRLADQHEFPRPLSSPVMVTFASEGPATRPSRVLVMADGVLVNDLPLHEDRDALRIAGQRGSVTLAFKKGSARITDASCKHKTCMTLGPIHRAGASLVCIPNRISITLDGNAAGHVDGITH